MSSRLVALDFDSDDFGIKLRKCLAAGTPVFFFIRGRPTTRLREFLCGESITDWTRLSGIHPLNRLAVAISLGIANSMGYRVLADGDAYRVEFFREPPAQN